MAIDCIAGSQQTSLLGYLGDGGPDLELSEQDIWEAAEMAAISCRSSYVQSKLKSAAGSMAHSSGVIIEQRFSAPMGIPKSSCTARLDTERGGEEEEDGDGDATINVKRTDSEGVGAASKGWETTWVAPHEIAAGQRFASRRQVMAFSMVEGPGRTLKGRDLTNLRNAVMWHTIGFSE
ncbi:hypothetical protein GOP47_0023228 [Adiantum capillus-veneris]|uniref:Uncharacterized protein n=1 Tax=Adiantum capillus-veneris TaxID=13818 RepID=A0A9D4U6Y2_ADICA|nr:hypothetical protein GOP47_0023228 [Adiantum capillus-veneris]